MTLSLLRNGIAITPIPLSEKTHGGIIKPADKDRPNTGTVHAIGPKVHDVQVGQTVLYSQWDGIPFFYEGVEYLILTEDQIQGVLV